MNCFGKYVFLYFLLNLLLLYPNSLGNLVKLLDFRKVR